MTTTKTKKPTRRPRPRPAPAKTSTSKPESAAAIAKRLGPMRKIVRWEANPRKHVKTQIAVLDCGHARALTRGPRKSYRCNQCRIEQRDGTPKLSRYQKALAATGKSPVIVTPQSRRAARKIAKTSRDPIGTPREVTREDVVAVMDEIERVERNEPEVERVAAYD